MLCTLLEPQSQAWCLAPGRHSGVCSVVVERVTDTIDVLSMFGYETRGKKLSKGRRNCLLDRALEQEPKNALAAS